MKIPHISNLPSSFNPRLWQVNFILNFIGKGLKDYLLCAFPGTGKTWAAIALAYKKMQEGEVDKVIVVVHTDQLRTQWIEKAAVLGVQLQPLAINDYTGLVLDVDSFDGIVLTYHQLANNSEVIRAYLSRYQTLTVLDEVHHCGTDNNKTWGPALIKAFDSINAQPVARLLLSGTPWRTDLSQIPFVKYERITGGWSYQIDFEYSYGDALRDGQSVSDVDFRVWDGVFEWEYDFEIFKHQFIDTIDKKQSRRRLRTAIDPTNIWLKDVLTEADLFLSQIRNTEQENAGGLVICENQWAARKIADFIKTKLKQDVELVISDDDNANTLLKNFDASNKKWLVSVQMVSEGVDIPRLRVCVFATNKLTKLFFMQVLGRVIRLLLGEDKTPDPPALEQVAYMWVPHTPELIPFMEEVKDAIDAFTREKEDGTFTGGGDQTKFWWPISADQALNRGAYIDGIFYPQDVLDEVVRAFAKYPTLKDVPIAEKLQIYTELSQVKVRTGPVLQPEKQEPTGALWNEKEKLGKRVSGKINALSFKVKKLNGLSGNDVFRQVNDVLGRKFGYGGYKSLPLDTLKAKDKFVTEHLQRANNGEFSWGDFSTG